MEWKNVVAAIGFLASVVSITGYSIKEVIEVYKFQKKNRVCKNGKREKIKLPFWIWLALSTAIIIFSLFKADVLSFKFFPDWDMADIYEKQQINSVNMNFDEAYKLNLSNEADEPDQAVGKFQLLDKNKKSLTSSSGFIISSDGIVVIPAFSIKNESAVSGEFITNEKTYKIDRVLNYSSTFDIAILKLVLSKGELTRHLSLGNAQKVADGDDIKLIGTPIYEEKAINEVIKGTISKNIHENKIGLKEMIGKISTERGLSGGPILNQNNQVIGICRTYSTDGSNKSKITPINTLEFLLRASNEEKVTIKSLNDKISKSYKVQGETLSGEGVHLSGPEFLGTIGYGLNNKTGFRTIYRNGLVKDGTLLFNGLVYANFTTNNNVKEYVIDWQQKESSNDLIVEYQQEESKNYRYGEGKMKYEVGKQSGVFNGDTVNLWQNKNNQPLLDVVTLEDNVYSDTPFLRYRPDDQTVSYQTIDKKDQLQGKYIELRDDKIYISNYRDSKRQGNYFSIELDSLDNPLVYKSYYENDELKEKPLQNTTYFRTVNQVEKQTKWRIIENIQAGADIVYHDDGSWQINQENFNIKMDKEKNVTLWKNLGESKILTVSYNSKNSTVTSFFSDKEMSGEYDVETGELFVKKETVSGGISDTILDNGEFVFLSENARLNSFEGIMYSNVSKNLYIGGIKDSKTHGFGVKNQNYMSYIGTWENNKIKQFYTNEYKQGAFEPSGIVHASRQ